MYVYPDKELHIHKYASAYSVITEKNELYEVLSTKLCYFREWRLYHCETMSLQSSSVIYFLVDFWLLVCQKILNLRC